MGGKEQLYICACEESVASVLGCHCSKNPQLFPLNMQICPLQARSTTGQYCLIRGVKLAGWVLLPPHPVQDQKNERCFPMQPVPTALAESASLSSQNLSLSLLKESERSVVYACVVHSPWIIRCLCACCFFN